MRVKLVFSFLHHGCLWRMSLFAFGLLPCRCVETLSLTAIIQNTWMDVTPCRCVELSTLSLTAIIRNTWMDETPCRCVELSTLSLTAIIRNTWMDETLTPLLTFTFMLHGCLWRIPLAHFITLQGDCTVLPFPPFSPPPPPGVGGRGVSR